MFIGDLWFLRLTELLKGCDVEVVEGFAINVELLLEVLEWICT